VLREVAVVIDERRRVAQLSERASDGLLRGSSGEMCSRVVFSNADRKNRRNISREYCHRPTGGGRAEVPPWVAPPWVGGCPSAEVRNKAAATNVLRYDTMQSL
jgi:hypothetical protein